MIGNVDGVNNDYLSGWVFDPKEPAKRLQVDVIYNGKRLIRATAGFNRPELLKNKIGDGNHGFYIALPAIASPESAEVVVVEAESRMPLGKPVTIQRKPTVTAGGLKASDVLAMHKIPLFSFEGFSLNGPLLTIGGMHLPPGGDPFAFKITGEPGVAFSVKHPIVKPAVRDWYWYWPNAAWSGFQIAIDLAASTHTGPDFKFTFESPGLSPERVAQQLNCIWIPKDLSVFQNFPTGDKLTRVHTFDNISRVGIGGYIDFKRLTAIAEYYGAKLKDSAVLDWGCGHGRVIRNFQQQSTVREAWGVDIDRENVAWMREHLPGIKGSHVPLMPPTELPKKHFGMIYAISVMTHLKHEVQEAWLKELKRIAAPGCIVMLTFAGKSSASFTSRFLKKDWLERWQASEFDDSLPSNDLVGKIDDPSYYTNTKQTPDNVREFWGKHFEILDIHECAFGYQDLAVMRAK